MTADAQSPHDDNGEDTSTRLAFNFFIGALMMALLAALWMLVQTALL